MHVRTRSPRNAASGGLCDRPRRRSGSDAQFAPPSTSIDSVNATPPASTRFVSVRSSSGRRTSVIQRTDVRSHAADREDCSCAGPAHTVSPVNRRLVAAVRWYQVQAQGRLSPCRFTPSCSCYAVEALELHGTASGLWLTLRRLLRCRPFGPSGYDPVPDVLSQKVM